MISAFRNSSNVLAVSAILIFIIACSCPSVRDGEQGSRGKDGEDASNVSNSDVPDSNAGEDNADSKEADTGDFVVEHIGVKNKKYENIDRAFRADKVLEKAADKLNRALKLPRDITLRTRDCNQINAYYNPRDHSITFCYELMEYFVMLYKLDGDNDKRANERMNKAITFVFLHEVGHALIDVYDLPITGNEEDAADRCSSYICIEELGEEGVNSIIAAAEAFAIESKFRKADDRNMADEHLLKEQRFFNSLCMIYGSAPSRYSSFKRDTLLPESRAARCPSEYSRTAKSWENLLRPWRKD